jgi:hypothetical protein
MIDQHQGSNMDNFLNQPPGSQALDDFIMDLSTVITSLSPVLPPARIG